VLTLTLASLAGTTTFSSGITAGDLLSLTLFSFDAFDNPTFHPDDSFYALLDLSPTSIPLTADFTLSLPVFKSGSHILRIFHSNTALEVQNSPFPFTVSPSAPSPTNTVHNLLNITAFDPSLDQPLVLSLSPADVYDNPVSDSSAFQVQIDDDVHPLLPPLYSYSKTYPADAVRDVSVTFLLNSSPLPNMPVAISVTPTIFASAVSSANVQLGGLALVFGAFVIFGLLQYLNKGSAAMSTLVSRRGELSWIFLAIFFNSLDPLSDLLIWYTVVRFCDAFSFVYLVLVVISCLAGALTITMGGIQLLALSKDLGKDLKLDSEEHQKELGELKVKYKESLVAKVARVMPTGGGEEEVDEEGQDGLEKKLLKGLLRQEANKKRASQCARERQRCVYAMVQVVLEDIPVTIVNFWYLTSECATNMDTGGGEFQFFFLVTFLTVTLTVFKIFKYMHLKKDEELVATEREFVMPVLVSEAEELLKKLRALRGEEGGEEGESDAQKIARLEREKEDDRRRREAAESRERAAAGREKTALDSLEELKKCV